MKHLFSVLFVIFLWCATYARQEQHDTRVSVDTMFFNKQYVQVSDSCADIVRFGHYNHAIKKFTGGFKDVSKANSTQIVARGFYTETGLKEGSFFSYHLNGNLESRGNFKDNYFSGKWEFFYASGRPKIVFEVNADDIKIIDTWNEEGKKMVDNGYGNYQSFIGAIVWEGKLIGGIPDGKWIAKRAYYQPETILATEHFKLGEFKKGTNQEGEYTDDSHIILLTSNLLPLIDAEYMRVSNTPCNSARVRNIMPAQYPYGRERFSADIAERLAPVLAKLHLNPFNEPIELMGTILKDGRIKFNSSKGIDASAMSALVLGLAGLPSLEPARVDGVAVQQDLVITLQYNSSVYSFNHRLLPIKTDRN